MGKVRHVIIGDESEELEQKKKADARREAKKAKKQKDTVSEGGESIEASNQTEVAASEGEIKKKKSSSNGPRVKSKRYQEAASLVEKNTLYSIKDAIALVKKTSLTKFDGTVEIHLNLNPQSLGGKNEYRGVVTLPHGSGKKLRVVVADDAVLEALEAGKMEFDMLVAHPTMMAKLAKYARVLGPKGLMPNPKNGTVSPDPEKRVKELSGGEVNFKTEPNNPIVHMAIGKVSFEDKQLIENIQTLFVAIGKNKIFRATLSATMGPGVKVQIG